MPGIIIGEGPTRIDRGGYKIGDELPQEYAITTSFVITRINNQELIPSIEVVRDGKLKTPTGLELTI